MERKSSTPLVRTNRPSSYLEGHIFPAEPESEPATRQILDFLGPAEHIIMSAREIYPYRLAQLSDAGGDISKRWRVIFYVWDTKTNKLVRRQKWISASFKTKAQKTAEANRLIKRINELLVDGYHLGESQQTKKSSQQIWTWAEAFDWVYQHREPSIRKRSIQTLELIRTELKQWIRINNLDHLPIQHVRFEHCDAFMQWLRRKRKIGNATYNNYLSFLKLNFNYLVSQQKLDYSPAARLHPLHTDEPENTHFSPAIKTKFLEAYPEELKIMAQYIYYSFIRPGELRKLQVKHIRDNSIFVPGYISKNRKSAHVLISPALERLLQDLHVRKMPPHFYLISHNGKPGPKPVSTNFFNNRHLQVRKDLGLGREYTLYCWKHTGVTDTYRQTRDIEFVSRQCRHSSLDMTKRYLRGLGLLLEFPDQGELPDLGL